MSFFSKFSVALLLGFSLLGCDREDDNITPLADEARFARVVVEFNDRNGIPISDLAIPYFRMLSSTDRSIRSVYAGVGDNLSVDVSTSVTYADGRARYAVLAVPGPTESINIGGNTPPISFRLPSADSATTTQVCFPAFVPFREPTELVAGESYLIRIELDLTDISTQSNRSCVDGSGTVAVVE